MKTLTTYERDAVRQRNANIITWHRLHPELSYADLGRIYHLSKQRVAVILNGTGKAGSENVSH